jgi:hypothetical protein
MQSLSLIFGLSRLHTTAAGSGDVTMARPTAADLLGIRITCSFRYVLTRRVGMHLRGMAGQWMTGETEREAPPSATVGTRVGHMRYSHTVSPLPAAIAPTAVADDTAGNLAFGGRSYILLFMCALNLTPLFVETGLGERQHRHESSHHRRSSLRK